MKIKALFLLGLVLPISLYAQINFTSYFDGGENNVSQGFYLSNSYLADYQFEKMLFFAGLQMDLVGASENVVTGSTFKIGRDFPLEKFPFHLEAIVLYNPFSSWVHEFNWGLLAKIQRTHFMFKLGTNFRTFSLSQKAIEYSDNDSNNRFSENWNIMYLLQYQLKPNENSWNTGIAVTNIDFFLIHQESNPMFNLSGRYNVKNNWTLFAETWYKPSGMFNISVNYFGFFIRTGIIWKMDLKK